MKSSLEAIEQLSPLIWRVMGMNPNHLTLTGTNTYIIGQKEERFLIDTGQGIEQYKENLEKILKQTGSRITKVLVTHWHLDHTMGIGQVLEVCPSAKVFKQLIAGRTEEDEKLEAKFNFKYNALAANEEVKGDGMTLVAVPCPGHTHDHLGFLLKEENAFFCGDCVMGWGSTRVEELTPYLQSLKEIKALAPDCIYPAHGPEIRGRDAVDNKIDEYVKHRLNREQQILKGLAGSPKGEASLSALLDEVYSEIKDDKLKIEARKNLVVHLRKLVSEGAVEEVKGGLCEATEPRYRLKGEHGI